MSITNALPQVFLRREGVVEGLARAAEEAGKPPPTLEQAARYAEMRPEQLSRAFSGHRALPVDRVIVFAWVNRLDLDSIIDGCPACGSTVAHHSSHGIAA